VVSADVPEPAAGHPGPASIALPAAIRAALIAYARAEYPNEMCGVIAGSADPAADGHALEWFPARNEAASPLRYVIHPDDAYRIFRTIDDADLAYWAVVHSHVRSPAVPSPTDLGLALFPEALYVLVSLADSEADPVTGAPSVRAWRIVDGSSIEVELTG
jgi:proteasome lid subunit RPN8/RPN11